MKFTTKDGTTVTIELEPVIKGTNVGTDILPILGELPAEVDSTLLAKGTGTSDTVTEIDRLLAKADATTDICLRAGYREKAALLRGAS